MGKDNYGENQPYRPQKTIKGGVFIRNAIVIALLTIMAAAGVMIANQPRQDMLAQQGAHEVTPQALPAPAGL